MSPAIITKGGIATTTNMPTTKRIISTTARTNAFGIVIRASCMRFPFWVIKPMIKSNSVIGIAVTNRTVNSTAEFTIKCRVALLSQALGSKKATDTPSVFSPQLKGVF